MFSAVSSYAAAAAVLFLTLHPALASAERVCNNSPLLCDRQYNGITHLGAHDSPFVRNSSNFYTLAGNQFYPSTIQLSAGVRLLSGQIHTFVTHSGTSEIHLCHTSCEEYDAGTLSGWLTELKRWLDKNKHDVVTILLVNGDDFNANQLNEQFKSAGIVKYAYIPQDTTKPQITWPTLNQLIDMDKRLIVFIASLDPKTNKVAPYLLNEFTFVFENNFDVTRADNFTCTANRPGQFNGKTAAALSSGRIPLMNHFLDKKLGADIEIPASGKARHTNAPNGSVGNFGESGNKCTKVYGAPPPLTLVDFFNDGPAIETVDRLNGVQGHISGRISLPQGRSPPLHSGGGF